MMDSNCILLDNVETALLSEIFCFLDIPSLGKVEETCKAFKEATSPAWKCTAEKKKNYLVGSLQSLNTIGPKRALLRFAVVQKFTERMARVHRRHYARFGQVYELPRQDRERQECSDLDNLKTAVFLKESLSKYEFFVRMAVLTQEKDPIIHEGFLPAMTPHPNSSSKYIVQRLGLKNRFEATRWKDLHGYMKGSASEQQAEGTREPTLFRMLSRKLMESLEVTVTAIDATTNKVYLVLATGGGREGSSFLEWSLSERPADSRSNPAARGFGVVPKVQSRILFCSDYSNLAALELTAVA